jgi:uncharacterized protein (DUF1697 family)
VRGINVGTAKRVAMADLRALVEALGYRDVKTLLNSGNVVFTAPNSVHGDAAARIEKALVAQLGVSARVIVITSDELAAALAENPLIEGVDKPSRLLISVLARPEDRAKLATLAQQDWKPEAVAIGKRVVYVWCPQGVIDSKALVAINRVLGDGVTARNLATMMKLGVLAGR